MANTFVSSDIVAPILNVRVHNASEFQAGYWAFAPFYDPPSYASTAVPMAPYIYDTAGELVWTAASIQQWGPVHDFKFGYDTFYFAAAEIRSDNELAKFLPYFMDNSLKLTENFTLPAPMTFLNAHELLIVDNGTSIILQDRVSNPSVRQNGVVAMEDRFFEISRSSGNVTFEWHSLDHISPAESQVHSIPGMLAKFADDLTYATPIFHVNSIDKLPWGDYLVSARHTSTIYLVSGADGSIIWRLGGLLSSFDLIGFNFSAQHDARYLGRDSQNRTLVSLLDNASMSGYASTSSISSGLIVALDYHNMAATVVRRFQRPDSKLSNARGNVQSLPSGNVFICWSQNGYTSEFTGQGDLVSEAWLEDEGLSTYRAFKYDRDVLSHMQPNEDPSIFVSIESNANTTSGTPSWNITAHASWNGGFALRYWRLLACSSYSEIGNVCHGEWIELLEVAKAGFETGMTATALQPPKAVRVQAFDEHWQFLRESRTVRFSSGDQLPAKEFLLGAAEIDVDERVQGSLYIAVVVVAAALTLLEASECLR